MSGGGSSGGCASAPIAGIGGMLGCGTTTTPGAGDWSPTWPGTGLPSISCGAVLPACVTGGRAVANGNAGCASLKRRKERIQIIRPVSYWHM